MSAHCNDCGTDLVHGTGYDWQLMTCPVCELRAENQRLRETLERIATGSRKGQYIEEWDGYSVRLPKVVEIAREALAGDTE